MWREKAIFNCNNKDCDNAKEALFLKWTGDPLHDQGIDTKDEARKEREIVASTCDKCGEIGFHQSKIEPLP